MAHGAKQTRFDKPRLEGAPGGGGDDGSVDPPAPCTSQGPLPWLGPPRAGWGPPRDLGSRQWLSNSHACSWRLCLFGSRFSGGPAVTLFPASACVRSPPHASRKQRAARRVRLSVRPSAGRTMSPVSGGCEGDTGFFWQFEQRDARVWPHSPSAERLHGACLEGDFAAALREGP